MDVIDGEELHHAWHDMSERSKRSVVERLKGHLCQLCALEPPIEGTVMSVTGGAMRDGSRVGLETFGPFCSHDDFHQFLRGGGAGIPESMDAFAQMRGIEKVVNSHREHYATKFTHGDFAPRNVMVKRLRRLLIGIALVGFPSTGNTRKRCSHLTRRMTG